MYDNISMFGYQSDSPAARAAYDMMVMEDLGILKADTKPGELNYEPSLEAPIRREW